MGIFKRAPAYTVTDFTGTLTLVVLADSETSAVDEISARLERTPEDFTVTGGPECVERNDGEESHEFKVELRYLIPGDTPFDAMLTGERTFNLAVRQLTGGPVTGWNDLPD
jgi:hypothetical protein